MRIFSLVILEYNLKYIFLVTQNHTNIKFITLAYENFIRILNDLFNNGH